MSNYFFLTFDIRYSTFRHMPINPQLLEILRCPQCRSEVKIDDEQTRLKCVNPECSLVYPIRDDIPVMLVDEAITEK